MPQLSGNEPILGLNIIIQRHMSLKIFFINEIYHSKYVTNILAI
jgi:hypothetical protein